MRIVGSSAAESMAPVGTYGGAEYCSGMYGDGEYVLLGNRSGKARGEGIAALARTEGHGGWMMSEAPGTNVRGARWMGAVLRGGY